MASSDLVKKVIQLKHQLTDTSKTSTLLKTLQKLQDLNVSLDVLSETGIGKTVNSLRKHKEVGEDAKSLVSHWKKLVPKDSSSNPVDTDPSQTTHRAAQEEHIHPGDVQKQKGGEGPPSQGESQETPTATKGSRKVEDKKGASSQDQPKEKNRREDVAVSLLDRETPHIQQDKCKEFKKDNAHKNLKKGHQEDENNNSVTQKKRSKHADHYDAEHGIKNSKCRPTSREKPHGASDPEKPYGDKESKRKRSDPKSTPERPTRHAGDKYSKSLPESASDKEEGTAMSRDSKRKTKKKKVVEKKEPCLDTKNDSERDVHSNTSSKKAKTKRNNSSDAGSGGLSLSFESCLSYDNSAFNQKARSTSKQPPRKKAQEKGEVPKRQAAKSIKWPLLSENGIGTNKVKGNVMDLLNTPLPEFLSVCDKQFVTDKSSTVDYYEPKRENTAEKEPSEDAEEIQFTGQRLNKKMQVYSGNKTSFLPTMISLYQQCIRTLQNNLELLHDTGGAPYEILEPVLEKCTPDQLLRVEDCNPSYIGLSDHLWGRHCQRDFRGSVLLEYESWKEMYLRLSEERENKFKRLAKTIDSAHSKKPQGRQVKMAFIHTVAKPPRDVRIQQEIYGTAGAVQPSLVRASVKIHKHRVRPSCLEPPKSAPTNSGTANPQDPRKKSRVAPMMVKSLKALKKQLGRR